MNKMLIATFFLLLLTSIVFSQLSELPMAMSNGVQNGITVDLQGTDTKVIEKEWIDYMKKYKGKTKKNKKSGEIFTDNATIKNMSDNTVDVYALAKATNGKTTFTVWYNLGGAYLNSADHPQKYILAKDMINDFATKFSENMAKEALEVEEKKLKKMNGELTDLEKTVKESNLKIEDFKVQIEALERKIETAQQAQLTKQKEIADQEAAVKKAKQKLEDVKQ